VCGLCESARPINMRMMNLKQNKQNYINERDVRSKSECVISKKKKRDYNDVSKRLYMVQIWSENEYSENIFSISWPLGPIKTTVAGWWRTRWSRSTHF